MDIFLLEFFLNATFRCLYYSFINPTIERYHQQLTIIKFLITLTVQHIQFTNNTYLKEENYYKYSLLMNLNQLCILIPFHTPIFQPHKLVIIFSMTNFTSIYHLFKIRKPKNYKNRTIIVVLCYV